VTEGTKKMAVLREANPHFINLVIFLWLFSRMFGEENMLFVANLTAIYLKLACHVRRRYLT